MKYIDLQKIWELAFEKFILLLGLILMIAGFYFEFKTGWKFEWGPLFYAGIGITVFGLALGTFRILIKTYFIYKIKFQQAIQQIINDCHCHRDEANCFTKALEKHSPPKKKDEENFPVGKK